MTFDMYEEGFEIKQKIVNVLNGLDLTYVLYRILHMYYIDES